MTDVELKERLSDFVALALTIYGEARGEPVEGKIAVGCVVRNRVAHPKRFAFTYRDVCLQRAAFSCWWTFGGRENYALIRRLAETWIAGGTQDLSGPDLATLHECVYIAEGIVGGQLRDRTGGANHYYAPAAMRPKGAVPEWARHRDPVARVNGHRFFKLP